MQLEAGPGGDQAEREVITTTRTTCAGPGTGARCYAHSERQETSDGIDLPVTNNIVKALAGWEEPVWWCCETPKTAHGLYKQRTTQKRCIDRASKHLEIRIHRGTIDAKGAHAKNSTHTAYPTKGLQIGEHTYDLVAVAVHHGTGAQEGHYTTYAMRGGAWFHANDTNVVQSTEAAAGNQIASMLWYTRREITHEETEEEASGTEEADREEQAERSTQAHHNAIKSKIESINQLKGDDWRALICTTGEHGESGWKRELNAAIIAIHPNHHDNKWMQPGTKTRATDAVQRLLNARAKKIEEDGGENVARAPQPTWQGKHILPHMQHQCPPPRNRALPAGTRVRVAGSAEGKHSVSPILDANGAKTETWEGMIVCRGRRQGGEYNVMGNDTRSWQHGINPNAAANGYARVPWQNITVIGAPATNDKGGSTDAEIPDETRTGRDRAIYAQGETTQGTQLSAAWRIYETQWLDDYDDLQDHNDWWDARTRANDDERRRHEALKQRRTHERAHKHTLSQTEGGEDTLHEQATASDDTTPERYKHKKPRGGDGSDERDENASATRHGKGKKRMASTTGEHDASTDAGASKAMTLSVSDIEETSATPESLPPTPEARPWQAQTASRQPEQELIGGAAAQADEGRRCATTTDVPHKGTKRVACAENEHDGAASIDEEGTARAAEDAILMPPKTKKRKKKRGQNQRRQHARANAKKRETNETPGTRPVMTAGNPGPGPG
jgi:hypothetical protein